MNFWRGRLWDAPVREWRLYDADDNEIRLDQASVNIADEVGRVIVLSPQDLEPNRSYRLREFDEVGAELGDSEFRTGDSRDDDVPPLPQEIDRFFERGRNTLPCKAPPSVGFIFEPADLIVVDVDMEATLDPASLTGHVAAVAVDDQVDLGYDAGGCLYGWPRGERSAQVRFGAFDVAGNFSGWTDPEEVSLRGCMCRSGEAAPASPALLLLCCVCLRRRPRRR